MRRLALLGALLPGAALAEPLTADDVGLTATIRPVFGATFPGAQTKGPLQMAELAFEAKQADKASVGLFGGFGTVDGVPGWDIGLDGRGYLLGDFASGLYIGAQAVYTHTIERGEVPPGTGIGFGPFVGAKYSTPFALAFDARFGAGAGWAGESFTEIDVFVLPIAQVGVGFSF